MSARLNLQTLKLQNFATFTNQQINFNEHFNSIVGETGSGKSLILDALQMIFGARADKKLVRSGSEFASIEATFTCNDEKSRAFFDIIGFPCEDDIVIKRLIYNNGKSKSFLNFQSCPLNILTQVARKFIDLVGQFENQKLLSDDYQLKLLDNFSGHSELYNDYKNSYNELKLLEAKLIDLQEFKNKSLERKDFLEFQINEIEGLSPEPSEENELKSKKDKILNYEKNQKTLNEINFMLSESNNSATEILSRAERLLDTISVDDSIHARFSNLKAELDDISFEITKLSNDEAPEDSVEEIIDRLDEYQRLKRKFNTDTEGLIQVLEKYQKEFSEIEVVDTEINKTMKAINNQHDICNKIATQLHENRVTKAAELSKSLTKLIQALNMKGAVIDIRISKANTLMPSGISKLDFYALTNPGEGYHPIKEIASGGELSRILLALRQVLSTTESISVFLFDEIDTGIGGETAITIGKALQEVSRGSQVIAITHLPQIANFSDQLLWVEKESVEINSEVRTESQVRHIEKPKMPKYIKEMQAL
ncbi:DNA repair protein RecN [Bacteriovorax sp. Seq25_V]|uniref:DNA repair protein RecN n=1 Tax=Bacteriovorax sp. Seq25_V TaxID=1201288 RepID=UPI00038A3CC1|nr:DNA repair protein RecN [Bacteriovorax sp. Seq25_V]EQC43294.1 putative DNA repair protein RecN [Bacteriovorax sp. Seq25_V]